MLPLMYLLPFALHLEVPRSLDVVRHSFDQLSMPLADINHNVGVYITQHGKLAS